MEIDGASTSQVWNYDVRMHDRGEIWLGGCRDVTRLTNGDYTSGFGGYVEKVSQTRTC